MQDPGRHVKKKRLTKEKRLKRKTLITASRIAKDIRWRSEEKSRRAWANLSKAALYWSSMVACNPIIKPRMRVRYKIWILRQCTRQQRVSAWLSCREGIIPDLGSLISWPDAISKARMIGRKLKSGSNPRQAIVQSSANADSCKTPGCLRILCRRGSITKI